MYILNFGINAGIILDGMKYACKKYKYVIGKIIT